MNKKPFPYSRKEIEESDFGRNQGWTVEYLGEQVAKLVDCRSEEMFWDSYEVQPIDGHTETLTEEFWFPASHSLRSIQFNECVVKAFGNLNPETGRVTLKLAYIKLEETFFEKIKRFLWRIT